MPSATAYTTPSLSTFIKSLKTNHVETSIELFISLLKRRQIRNSRPCAIATTHLLLRIVIEEDLNTVDSLIDRIRHVGRRIIVARPHEMAVGSIVRRILGVVREVAEEQDPAATAARKGPSIYSSLLRDLGHASRAVPEAVSQRPKLPGASTSLFDILKSGQKTAAQSTVLKDGGDVEDIIDVKAEVISGIEDLLEELEVVDTQIGEYALDHIHAGEVILTHTSSQTVQRFLLAAAKKRKFTVYHAEAYPNEHETTHDTAVNGGKKVTGDAEDGSGDGRWKALTAAGITVIVIPDSAVFALMSRINKVILAPHTVFINGDLIATAGAVTIAATAKEHHVPVVVLSGVYKLSPVYPYRPYEFIEHGDPGKIVPYHDGELMGKIDVTNPVYDFVLAELIDLYITNLGGVAPSYLYRIVKDHYRDADVDLDADSEVVEMEEAEDAEGL